LNARPSISCLDPESTVPGTPSAIASYGNMVVTGPDKVHQRTMRYHDLGMQKQETIILRTNGQASSRQVYQDPTNISILVQNPAFDTSAIGYLEVTVHYVFSGQRSPSVGQQSISLDTQFHAPQEKSINLDATSAEISSTLTRE